MVLNVIKFSGFLQFLETLQVLEFIDTLEFILSSKNRVPRVAGDPRYPRVSRGLESSYNTTSIQGGDTAVYNVGCRYSPTGNIYSSTG